MLVVIFILSLLGALALRLMELIFMAYPPKRPNSHIIDTEACSFVTSLMPSENWVVRDLTERDFGIDKIFERFENGFATGELMAIQVKGTSHSKINLKFHFPLIRRRFYTLKCLQYLFF